MQAAREIVDAGALGALDDCRHHDFLAKLTAETDYRSVDDVFATPSTS
ncbi:hypothetical protein [Prescottella agglutinans]|nr:hypothetical protein [Prescottella agglutinans]